MTNQYMLHLFKRERSDVELEHEEVDVVEDVSEVRAAAVPVHLLAFLPHQTCSIQDALSMPCMTHGNTHSMSIMGLRRITP